MSTQMIKDIDRYYCSSNQPSTAEYDQVVSAHIKYYHCRARRCKWGYYGLSSLKILLTASIPVFQALTLLERLPYLVTIFSSVILAAESISSMMKLRDKWVLYRDMCSGLMCLQRRFMAVDRQRTEEERRTYVNEVESILEREAGKWKGIASQSWEENTDKGE